jgi:hypothetical protein
MNKKIISKRSDRTGRTRYYVLPVESRNGFDDLIKFVSQEFSCALGEIDEGPGSVVQRAKVEGEAIVFVLSDSTGAQFYPEEQSGVPIAERIANSIEGRIREIGS